MRLISLRIQNVRGIKDSTFDLAGENMVLSGPNGSGKSAVIDAVDFLLTGKMSRLEGEGTRGITLKSHGPHVDHEPSETVVEAEVKLKSIPEPIRISRSLASPGDLDYPEEAEEAIESVLETAKKGQHALSRRQILRFIAAESGKRAKDVQELLDLEEVEVIRKALGTATREISQKKQEVERSVTEAESSLEAILVIPEIDPVTILAKINDLRGAVGAGPLKDLKNEDLRSNVTPPGKLPSMPREVSNFSGARDAILRRLARIHHDRQETGAAFLV